MSRRIDLFLKLGEPLYRYAYLRLGQENKARCCVEDVFLKLPKNATRNLQESQLLHLLRQNCDKFLGELPRETNFVSDWVQSEELNPSDRDRWQTVQRLLETLPEPEWQVLVLRAIGSFTLEEIGCLQNCDFNTVSARHQQALQKLGADLENWLGTLPLRPVNDTWKSEFVEKLRRLDRQQRLVQIGALVLLALGGRVAYQKMQPVPGQLPRQVLSIPVRGLMELDGKSLADLSDLRREAWKGLPDLGPEWNSPLPLSQRPAWQSVASGGRWIGVKGQLTSTSPGNFPQQFHEGDSMASFFLLNPLVLIGLQNGLVAQGLPGSDAYQEGARQELVCAQVELDGIRRELRLLYKLPSTSPVRDIMRRGQQTHLLNLVNAYDLGFSCYQLVASETRGFTPLENPGRLYRISQIYTAHPVAHGSEPINQLYVRKAGFMPLRLTSLPAQLTLRLWRAQLESPNVPPDLTEIIRVE